MKFKKFLSFILCIILTAALSVIPASAATYSDKLNELADLIRQTSLYSSEDDDPVMRALEKYFNENPEEFEDFADYIFRSYDRYSDYFSPEEYAVSYPTATEYVGIGVEMDDSRDGGNFIRTVFPGSPAEEAGILAGDEIVSVDGIDVTSYSLPWLTSLVRGPADTEVVIGIRRQNRPSMIEFRIIRKPISMSNIEFSDMGNGVAYMRILRFGDLKTFFDFANIYVDLPNQGFRSVIIDVRGNPGGDLNALLNILNYIIPENDKELMSLYARDTGHESFFSTGEGWHADKIVVLVNERSASAAEVFAGTLQLHGYAEIVGQQTYGKGVGQYHIPLSDDSVAVITSFEIFLPGHVGFDGKGITPDHIVELGTAPYPISELGPLSHMHSIYVGEVSESVLELEKRLHLLGYFSDTPDETFDDRTLFAVQAFAEDVGLKPISCASGIMIYHLNKEIENLSQMTVTVDTQLEKAYELAFEAIK
jgi:carboxyl-terminal processing protease